MHTFLWIYKFVFLNDFYYTQKNNALKDWKGEHLATLEARVYTRFFFFSSFSLRCSNDPS